MIARIIPPIAVFVVVAEIKIDAIAGFVEARFSHIPIGVIEWLKRFGRSPFPLSV